MTYQQTIPSQPPSSDRLDDEHVIPMSDVPPGPVLEDEVLRNVRAAWERIVGDDDDVGRGFMIFEDRQEAGDDGEEGADEGNR